MQVEETAEAKCLRLAARQHGVVSYVQLRASGLSKSAIWRRTRSSTWTEMLPGVYVVQGTPPTWPQRQMAACLWGGEGAVASHRAASALQFAPKVFCSVRFHCCA